MNKTRRRFIAGGVFGAAVIQTGSHAANAQAERPANLRVIEYLSGTDVQAAHVEPSPQMIRTLGYYVAGDGGGALYRRVSRQPQHNLWIQSADGAVWEWADSTLNVLMAGARDDGIYDKNTGVMSGTDNTQSIQNAIDAHTYFHVQDAVYFPIHNTGMYRITGTIHCGYGVSFTTTRVIGAGTTLRGERQFNGPTLLCDFSDAMAVNHQGARGNVWRGVSLIGRNWAYGYHNNLGAVHGAAIDDTNAEAWLDPSLDSNAGSRYAPYAGFCIDGYSGTAPWKSYPEVRYPHWLGHVGQYQKAFSSDIEISDFYLGGFGVGIVTHPSGSDGNGDFIRLRHGLIEYTQYCISISHTQCRNFLRDSLNYNGNYCVLTNNKHGLQRGAVTGPDINGSAGKCINIFDLGGTSIGGPLVFQQFYAEALWRIGDLASPTASETSIHFDGCKLHFTSQNDARGVPSFILGGPAQNHVPIIFTGGLISNFASVAVFAYDGADLIVNGLTIHTQSKRIRRYEQFAHNATGGGVCVHGLSSRSGSITLKMVPFDVDKGHADSAQIVGPRQLCDRSHPASFYATRLVGSAQNDSEGVWNPAGNASLAKNRLLNVRDEGRLLSFEMPIEYEEWQFAYFGPLLGDVLMDEQTGTVWFVQETDIRSRVVKAVRQNNFKVDASAGFIMLRPVSFTSGRLVCGNARQFTPRHRTLGDISTGSTNITNVGLADGNSEHVANDVANGDYLYIDQERDLTFLRQTSLVRSVSMGPAVSLEIAGKAEYTGRHKDLAVFIRVT